MGNRGGASVSSPDVPEIFINPNLRPNIDTSSFIGQSLSQGGFLPGSNVVLPRRLQRKFGDGSLDFLFENTSLNPEITSEAIGLASRDLIRIRDEAQKQVQNQLEASNQTNSSVANTSLNELNREFSADVADITTNFALADQQRVLQTRLNLFGLGLGTLDSATARAQQDTDSTNAFNLANFQNQLAANALEAQNQSSRGGLLGGLTGAAGGGLLGFALGGPIGAGIGALGGGGLGGFGPQGTGAQLLGAGGTAAGLSAGGFFTPTGAQSGTSGLSRFLRSDTLAPTGAEQFGLGGNKTANSFFGNGGQVNIGGRFF